MQAYFSILFLIAASTIFATSTQHEETLFIAKRENPPLFERYLAFCHAQSKVNQPVYLQSASRSTTSPFTDLIILGLEFPSIMQIHDVAERILYADSDVVYLSNVSTQVASHLYESLEHTYSHFIHVPSHNTGLFIASKLPLSEAELTVTERESKEMLEFVIAGTTTCHLPVSSKHTPIRIVDPNRNYRDQADYVLLVDLPGTITSVKPRFFPLQTQTAKKWDTFSIETFQILPIKHKSNDRAGYEAEIEIGRSWGGQEGGRWEGSVRVEAHDGRGNYVEGEVKQNDQGEGSARARAGHEEN